MVNLSGYAVSEWFIVEVMRLAMVRDIVVPTKENFDSLVSQGQFAMPRCISSCRGCQCHINTFSVDDMFNAQKGASMEGLFVPNAENYDSLIHGYNSEGAYCGCRCNCTSCNSCRCDCSCRITNNPEDYSSLIWDC